MKSASLLLVSLCFLAGCASKRAWSPVEAEQGLVYGSSCRAPADRWPVATLAYYEATFYAPEITKEVNETQNWEHMGKRIEFNPSGKHTQ